MIPLVEQLAETWTSIDELCSTLSEDDWKAPTGCPGWTVQDNVSHLIDFESFALGRSRPDHAVSDLSHTKNEMGAVNEVGVDVRRSLAGDAVLAEFRDVTAARLQSLSALTDDDLVTETSTPIGPGTIEDLLTLRVMDTWAHEQDIRRALGRPGHDSGPVVGTVLTYWSRFLPYAVAKLAGAPEGTTAVFAIGAHPPVAVAVEGGRGHVTPTLPGQPTVEVRTDPVTFGAAVCGRSDVRLGDIAVTGDDQLGRRIVEHLGFMP